MAAAGGMRERVVDYIARLQGVIVAKLETYGDGQKFRRDTWTRDEGGGGLACTFPPAGSGPTFINDGHPIEKAGVNISTITGVLPPLAARQMSTTNAASKGVDDGAGHSFFAAGLSLIIHPRHPRVPAVHANYRYFEVLTADASTSTPAVRAWWFGAITDLTPAYVDAPFFTHFHRTLKTACDAWINNSADTAIPVSVYPIFKTSCDDYFFIPHRSEHRGIGGIRFDNMDPDAMRAILGRIGDGETSAHVADLGMGPGASLPEDTIARLSTPGSLFKLVQTLGDAFLPSFLPLLDKHIGAPVVPSERRWQLLRRARSVEFNLVVDRGTRFGLATSGIQAENVLVGMPPEARWEYACELDTGGTEEAEMVRILKEPRRWVDLDTEVYPERSRW